MPTSPRRPDLLASLDFVTGVIATLMLLALLVNALYVAFGDQEPSEALGVVDVCAEDDWGVVETPIESRRDVLADPDDRDLRVRVERTAICDSSPSTGLQAAAIIEARAPFFYALGFFVGCRVLVRRARREGVFTTTFARGVRRLGWYLLLGHLAVLIVMWFTQSTIVEVLSGERMDWTVIFKDFSIPTLVGGCAALSVGAVLRNAVLLREDSEATI